MKRKQGEKKKIADRIITKRRKRKEKINEEKKMKQKGKINLERGGKKGGEKRNDNCDKLYN